jgi:tetratricopeptide (TPR) repeat protein
MRKNALGTYCLCAALAMVCLAFWLVPQPAIADQTDPLLDQLFEHLQTAGDPREAQAIDQEIWQRWTASGDQDIDLLMRHGVVAMQSGQLAVADATFSDIITVRPKFSEAWNKRATVRYFMGKLDDSITDCAQVLVLEARHYGAMSGLGLILLARNDKAGAIRWFERALAVNPHMAVLRDKIGTLRKELNGRPI